MKKFNVVLFTDISSRTQPIRPLGAYRLASELRQAGYSVLVVSYFSKWLMDPDRLAQLLSNTISDETLAVGFSSTFYSESNGYNKIATDWKSFFLEGLDPWPVDYEQIRKLITTIKTINKNVKVFYGGSQADFYYRHPEALNVGIDYILQGFADHSFIDSINRLAKGISPKFKYSFGFKIIDFDELGLSFDFPNSTTKFHDSDFIESTEVLPLEASRGCLFRCAFCAHPLIGRNKNDPEYHRTSSLEEEIRENYNRFGVTNYMFIDDTFNETTEKLREIATAVKNSGIKINCWAYLRLDLLERFPEQITLLKEIGLKTCFLGVETFNEAAGKSIGKISFKLKNTLSTLRTHWGEGVSIYASLIAGLPHEDKDTINEWMQWVEDSPHLIDGYRIITLGIVPGRKFTSVLDREYEKFNYRVEGANDWINNKNFSRQDADELVDFWMTRSWDSGRNKVSSWDLIGLLGLGYEFDYLKNLSIKDLPFDDINQHYMAFVERYQTKLINYLQNND